MAVCNVNTLLSDGKDFQRCSDQDVEVCIAQLLCDISAGSIGGSPGGIGDPNGVVTGVQYSSWNQFDAGGNYIQQWHNQDGGTVWV